MVKQHFKNRPGFFLVEMIAVLMIVSIIVIILSRISINTYEKYQERLAVNELVSEIYTIQTKSLGKDRSYICFFSSDDEYAEFAPEAYKYLAGRAEFVVAGAPACTDDLKAVGIENFINVKSNVLETLRQFNQKLGIN